MSLFPERAVEHSTLVGFISPLAARLRTAAAEARTLGVLQGESGSGSATPVADEAQDTTDRPSEEAAQSTVDAIVRGGGERSSPVLRGSTIYPFFAGIQALVRQSWLYRWLTAEPEPEVIVIDLRDTRTAGPIIDILDRGIRTMDRELRPATRGATLTRLLNWVRVRFAERPIRVVSIVVAVFVNLGLLSLLAGETDPLQPMTFFLLGLLLLAVRGFRSTISWAELTETTWYRRTKALVVAVFEPPEPPESPGPREEREREAGEDGEESAGPGREEPPTGEADTDSSGNEDG